MVPLSPEGGDFSGNLWALFAQLPALPTNWRQTHWLLLLGVAARKIPANKSELEKTVNLLNDALNACLEITRSENVWNMVARGHEYVHGGEKLTLWSAPDDREQFVHLHKGVLERLISDRRHTLSKLMAGFSVVSPDAPPELVQIAVLESARLSACIVAADMILKAHEADEEITESDFEGIMKHTQATLQDIEEIRELVENED